MLSWNFKYYCNVKFYLLFILMHVSIFYDLLLIQSLHILFQFNIHHIMIVFYVSYFILLASRLHIWRIEVRVGFSSSLLRSFGKLLIEIGCPFVLINLCLWPKLIRNLAVSWIQNIIPIQSSFSEFVQYIFHRFIAIILVNIFSSGGFFRCKMRNGGNCVECSKLVIVLHCCRRKLG